MRLRTEGSNRWEKGVDPHLAEQAAKLATQLLIELAGARWVGHTDVKGELPERPRDPRIRPQRADEVIGLSRSTRRSSIRSCERLGFERRDDDVVVPTWRARDVTREIDVVEEVARFRMDEVPFTLPARRRDVRGAHASTSACAAAWRTSSRVSGLVETYTPSLREDDLNPDAWRLSEPISIELAVLRTRLLPSLVDAARRNLELGARGIALFELAHVYRPNGTASRRAPTRRRHRRGRLEPRQGRRRGALRGAEGGDAVRARGRRPLSSREVRLGRRGCRRRALPGD